MGGKKTLLVAAALLLGTTWPGGTAAQEGPGEVVLDSLAALYEPVRFDHAMHVELVGECVECHHHTLGQRPKNPTCASCHHGHEKTDRVACRDCHAKNRFSASYLASIAAQPFLFHIDTPGLKGAFHQRCLGCHVAMEAPSGCEDCHALTNVGEAFYHTGAYAPQPAAGNQRHH